MTRIEGKFVDMEPDSEGKPSLCVLRTGLQRQSQPPDLAKSIIRNAYGSMMPGKAPWRLRTASAFHEVHSADASNLDATIELRARLADAACSVQGVARAALIVLANARIDSGS